MISAAHAYLTNREHLLIDHLGFSGKVYGDLGTVERAEFWTALTIDLVAWSAARTVAGCVCGLFSIVSFPAYITTRTIDIDANNSVEATRFASYTAIDIAGFVNDYVRAPTLKDDDKIDFTYNKPDSIGIGEWRQCADNGVCVNYLYLNGGLGEIFKYDEVASHTLAKRCCYYSYGVVMLPFTAAIDTLIGTGFISLAFLANVGGLSRVVADLFYLHVYLLRPSLCPEYAYGLDLAIEDDSSEGSASDSSRLEH